MNFDLSIVVPAYKPGEKIFSDIETKKKVLDEMNISYELIYVFDGFVDSTQKEFFEKTKLFAEKLNSENEVSLPSLEENSIKKVIKILGYSENHGKGFAVRTGFQNSSGKFVGFIDFLNDISANYLKTFYEEISKNDLDLVIPNKFHDFASFESSVKFGLHMKETSKIFTLWTKFWTGLQLPDTQTGIKFFKGESVRKILQKLKIERFAFDIEMIVAMFRNGFDKIKILPIDLSQGESTGNGGKSTVSGKQIIKALIDVVKIGFFSRVLKNYKI